MGSPKPLVDLGGRTMLEAVVEPLSAAGVERVVVVTTSAIAAELPAALRSRIELAINEDPASEMIDSIRIGLAAIDSDGAFIPDAGDGVLICPGDQPGIAAADVRQCVAAFGTSLQRIVVASYRGRRGHPILLPWSLAEAVRSTACDRGLDALLELFPERVTLVSCSSAGVVEDLDMPEELTRWRARGEPRG